MCLNATLAQNCHQGDYERFCRFLNNPPALKRTLSGRKIELVTTSHRPVHVNIMQSEVFAAATIENLVAAGSFRREEDECQIPRLKPDDKNLTNMLENR